MESIEVGCAIIHKEGRLLIAQRHLQDSYGGYWEFPGGKREPNETIQDCLVREVYEELAVRIHPEKLLCRKDLDYPTRKVSLFFYFCAWREGEAVAHDCKDFRWVSKNEIVAYSFIPGDQEVLNDLFRHWEEYFKTRENCR